MPTFFFLASAERISSYAIGKSLSVRPTNRISQCWAFLPWLLYLGLLGLQPTWGQHGPDGLNYEVRNEQYFVYPGDAGGLGVGYSSCSTITQHPASQTACSARNNGLQYAVITAGSTDQTTYEWEFNDNDGKGWVSLSGFANDYPGYNTVTLTTNGTEKDGRQYRVKISDSCGTIYSQPATFTLLPGPTISAEPASQSACSGQGLQYTVKADGTDLTYDWEYNDGGGWVSLSANATLYPGYNTATLTTNGDETPGRQYRAKITSGSCTVYSRSATFTQGLPPNIRTQPLSQTACSANGIQFSVQADGTDLRYAWQYYDSDGAIWVTLDQFQTNTLTISDNFTPSTESFQVQYRAIVSNGYCSVTSQSATLTKTATALITQQPADQTACSGKGLQYRVQVRQEASLSYDWEFNDGGGWASLSADTSLYGGYNTAVLTTKGDEPTGRQYRVNVNNRYCPIYSDPVTFTKLASAVITQQPASQTACSGKGLQYSVQADGEDLAYDWEFNDNDGKGWVSLSGFADSYPGYYTATLTTNGVETPGRQYRVKIINECDSVLSEPATLTLQSTPTITRHPTSQTACSGKGLQYEVVVDGTGLTYDWEFNDNDGKGWMSLSGFADLYPGYNTATLTTNGTEKDGRQYRVKITNRCGVTVYSQSATFTFTAASPVITGQPSSQTACLGKGLQYEVVVEATGLTYDWEFNDNDGKGWVSLSGFADLYPGYNTATLTTNGTEKNGRQYRAKVTNLCDSTVYSNSATFTLTTTPPVITRQPASRTACSGKGLQYDVLVDGTGLTYDWEYNDGQGWTSLSVNANLYPGYNTATLTTNGDETNGRQYRVRIENVCGSQYAKPATFTLQTPLAITSQPPSTSNVIAGATVTASVNVTGAVSAYQWYKDGLPLVNQTGSRLLLTNVGVGQTGTYWLVAVSSCNSVTSTTFSLSVTAYPIRYVRQGGTGDGTSWETASGDLQAMINASNVEQVLVAQGTYKPTISTDRSISFSMKEGVSIYGGFPPSGSPTLAERNPASYTTTLSGDIGVPGDASDNSYHVFVNPPELTASAILDGVLITGGNANDAISDFNNSGAGMYSNEGSPRLINCMFKNNAAFRGGAVYNTTSKQGGVSNPTLINCLFQENSAGAGGAFFNEPVNGTTANPSFINCSFLGNRVTNGGGAFCSTAFGPVTDQPRFVNCVLFNNGGDNTFYDANSGLLVQYCLLETGTRNFIDQGNNLITSVSPFSSGTDARLNPCSPAINAGSTPDYTQAAGPATDVAANPRFYQNGTIDMGAYEYQGTASQPVGISAQPLSATSVLAGSSVTVSVSVTGTVGTYQWYKDGLPLTGQTSATLSLSHVQTGNAGNYVAVILGSCNSLTSTAFILSVTAVVDLVPTLYVRPTLLYGQSLVSVVVDVDELGGVSTSGTITLKITKDAKLALELPADATSVGGHVVTNKVWQLSLDDPNYYVLSTTAPVPGAGRLSVGLAGVLGPEGTAGVIVIGGDLIYTGGEQSTANNLDSEKIEYFPQ